MKEVEMEQGQEQESSLSVGKRWREKKRRAEGTKRGIEREKRGGLANRREMRAASTRMKRLFNPSIPHPLFYLFLNPLSRKQDGHGGT